jgi:aspartokinase
MNIKLTAVIACSAALATTSTALAQLVTLDSRSDGAAVIDKLQKQKRMDELKAKFWTQEPVTQQDYYVQEKQDRQLIARISAGEQVSPDELAQALKRVDTDY